MKILQTIKTFGSSIDITLIDRETKKELALIESVFFGTYYIKVSHLAEKDFDFSTIEDEISKAVEHAKNHVEYYATFNYKTMKPDPNVKAKIEIIHAS